MIGREALRQYLSSASIDLRMKPHFETYEDLLAEVKRLRALADALFDLIPSHLSTEATDIWNEHMEGEEE